MNAKHFYKNRKTLLGPVYDSPLKQIEVLPMLNQPESNSYYLAYITGDKVSAALYVNKNEKPEKQIYSMYTTYE